MNKLTQLRKSSRDKSIAVSRNVFAQVRVLSARTTAAVSKSNVSSFRGMFAKIQESRFSLKDQVFFIKRLSFLMNAGITVVDGLHVLRDQAKSKGHARVLDHIVNDVINGQSIAKSFAKHPKAFNDFSVQIIKIGESSGTLSQNLEYLADELKKRHELRRKVMSAFIYPAIIVLATLGITAFLMLYLFPKITPIFTSLHATLPLSTRIIMALSIFFQHWWILVIVLLVLVIGGFTMALKRIEKLHFVFDRSILRIPVIGQMIQSYNIANISRTMGLLLKSGVKISEGLIITADTTKNLVYKQECKKLSEVVDRGERISSHMQTVPAIFPDIFSHMIAVGERSGTLSKTLVYLSEMYEKEVEEFTKNLSILIEPALMIFMGLLVGFIAISIITPIYGITQNLHV